VYETSTARGSTLIAEELIPLLQKEGLVLFDERVQLRQLATPKTNVARKTDRFDPELGVAFRLFNVDVRRLFALVAEEEEPVTAYSKNRGHTETYRATRPGTNRPASA